MESEKTKINFNDFLITEHPDQMSNDLFHFTAKHRNCPYFGFGTNKDRRLALKIALNEGYERLIFKNNSTVYNSTNGLAVHDSNLLAKENAICELLERDAIFVSWLSRRPVNWLTKKFFSTQVLEKLILFERFNLEVKLGLVAILNGRFCCVGYLRPTDQFKTFGATFSAKTNKNLDEAFLGVIKDLRRSASIILSRLKKGKKAYLTDSEKSEFGYSAQYHFEYYLDPKNMKHLESYINTTGPEYIENSIPINVEYISPNYILPWPARVVHASSQNLQSFYLRDISIKKVNLKRMKMFDLEYKALNTSLHFLP